MHAMTGSSPLVLWHTIGYLFAIAVPLIPLREISRLLWRQITLVRGVPTATADANQNRDLPALIGVLERILYVAAILTGAKELVGVWLAMKVAGGWELWKEGTIVEWIGAGGRHTAEIGGRSFFNTFLVGSALSLLNATAAAGAIDSGLKNHYWLAFAQLFAAVALTLGIWLAIYVRWRSMRERFGTSAT